ncbi:MAG: radical SAM protein [Clostridiaceae bacterium]|jgi:pyruvate formate lyase activating enzyme|nr:radical SAM protein [Clostridiaceae bacterium]
MSEKKIPDNKKRAAARNIPIKLHSIESLAALDGEGLRTVLFMQGCPARCFYCHNPDAVPRTGGKEYSPEELFAKILRFRPYYGDDGGATFSGGEPCLQAKALLPLARMLKNEHINITLDTAGAVLSDDVRALLKCTDAVLLDIKMPSDALYREKTGIPQKRVYDFLDACLSLGVKVTGRYVAVPGVNDGEDTVADVVRSLPKGIAAFEVLGFHKMGEYKYGKMGMPCPTEGIPAMSVERVERLQKVVDEIMLTEK